ncbi:MAG: hypothetical protein KF893_26065 [Caldilineaceae bacterium]|nr:hypothetical protein [Caldilineaceae bacterium]
MKAEYDFSRGKRGRFFQEDAVLRIPIYLDPDVAQAIQSLAEGSEQTMNALVNDWLRNNLAMIHSVQPLPNP